MWEQRKEPAVIGENYHGFIEIIKFIQEIEYALGLGPAKQCPLREFLTVYIKNIFLNQVLAEINKEIEGVTKTSDPLKILANADTMKVLGVQRPLLQRRGRASHQETAGREKRLARQPKQVIAIILGSSRVADRARLLVGAI
ncbi:hypothetical protein MC885_020827 [Smutsia gigantea]|nr:hypothetical protein MC885_020827 [Smutsia gigantea]